MYPESFGESPIFTTSDAALWQSWTEVLLDIWNRSRMYSRESWKSEPLTNSMFSTGAPSAFIIRGIIFS